MRDSALRIVVMGLIVRFPVGGLAWHYLHYVLGLRQLGHDVVFAEDSGDVPQCYDPLRNVTDANPSYGLHFAEHTFQRLGLGGAWTYYDAHEDAWHGPLANRGANVFDGVDLLVNVSKANTLRAWAVRVPRRICIDTDPAFTQIRNLTNARDRRLTADHTHFFTFAEQWGHDESMVPDDGFPWQPTRQPVVLSQWPPSTGRRDGPFTTVMQWDSYPDRTYAGERYGMKSRSFRPIVALPQLVNETLELALGGPNAPRDWLTNFGWRVSDPLAIARDPWGYVRYIRRSKAEFSVAKHGYVASRSGWFSERSANYLASGRPVVTQDTGFSNVYPTGEGLFSFRDVREARDAIEHVRSDYARHCRAAREIAEDRFSSDTVLTQLIERAFA